MYFFSGLAGKGHSRRRWGVARRRGGFQAGAARGGWILVNGGGTKPEQLVIHVPRPAAAHGTVRLAATTIPSGTVPLNCASGWKHTSTIRTAENALGGPWNWMTAWPTLRS